MMRLLLLVAFYLLTSAATAYAECAWVLWGYYLDAANPGLGKQHVESAHATRQECGGAVSNMAMALRGSGYDVAGGSLGSYEVLGKKGTLNWKYYCLPDTIDPRGPKGGAR